MRKINITFKFISIFEFLIGVSYNDYSRVLYDNPTLQTSLTLTQIDIGFLFFKIGISIHNYEKIQGGKR